MSDAESHNSLPVVVSVDTEEDAWHPSRNESSVENIRELPRLAAFFQRLGVRPTYFTTFRVAREPWAASIIRSISSGGAAEVGAHLHPWNTPPLDEPFGARNLMLNNLREELQRLKLRELTRTLEAALGHAPTSFRAGRFGLGPATVRALVAEAYEVDSSVTPFLSWGSSDDGPNFVGAPLRPYRLSERTDDVRVNTPDGSIVEIPLSVGYSRFSPAHWLRLDRLLDMPAARAVHLRGIASRGRLMTKSILSPETCSVRDMLALSQRLLEAGAEHLHFFFHSPSLRPGLTPFVRTSSDVERLYASIEEYLDGLSRLTSLRFVTVREAAGLLGPGRASSLTGGFVAPATRRYAGRRLLVISYHFPPDGAVGGLRWAGFSKYLARLGWDVKVLTAAATAGVPATPGVETATCHPFLTLNDGYRKLTRAEARDTRKAVTPTSRWGGPPSGRSGAVTALRAEVAALLGLPDVGRGWVLRAARRARSVIRRFSPEVVVSSGPPHSAHIVAALATAGSGCRWVVDLRDPWWSPFGDLWRWDPLHRSKAARWLDPWLERVVFRAADLVVANTRELAAALSDCYPGLPAVWIRNGVDREGLPELPGSSYPGLTVSYVGTLYGNRVLTPILRSLRTLLDRTAAAEARPVVLRVAGHAEGLHLAQLRSDIESLDLATHVEMLGLLRPREALRVLSRSSLAVVLAQAQDLQVPAKLYETVALGVPTLVLASSGSATAREALELGAVVLDSADDEGIVRVLERASRRDPSLVSPPRSAFHYSDLAQDLAELLVGVCDRGRRPSTVSTST